MTAGSTNVDALKEGLRRWTLIFGVAQITVGCIVGFIPPPAVQWFRGIVSAHIEYTANGVLMIAFAFVVRELALGSAALKVWFATLQIGTWTNGTAGLIAALIGYSSQLLPTINEKFPAPNGSDHPLVSGSLMVCGVTIMICLLITIVGLVRRQRASVDERQGLSPELHRAVG
jgi:hypothetical protein